MMTKAFEDAIRSALLRIPGMTPKFIDEHLYPLSHLCRLIVYNESAQPATKSDAERLLMLSGSAVLPEHLEAVRAKANTFVNNNAGFRTDFKSSMPSARSILNVGLSLHMTVDEINSALLSYSYQTISWHRVEDLLLRYAVAKGWLFTTLQGVMWDYHHNYLKSPKAAAVTAGKKAPANAGNGATREIAQALPDVNSAYLTRQNISIFYEEFVKAANDYTVYERLHELFAPAERASNGAPRRVFLKMTRLLQGGFCRYIVFSPEVKDAHFKRCRTSNVQSAHFMLYEAAGLTPPDVPPKEAALRLTRVITAIDDLLHEPSLQRDENAARPIAWFDAEAQAARAQQARAAQEESRLTPATLLDTVSCDLILRTIDRNLPQELRYNLYAGGPKEQPMRRRMLQIAGSVQSVSPESGPLEQSYRGSLFQLLLCCGCGDVRPLLADGIRQVLSCFGFTVLEAAPESPGELVAALGYPQEQATALLNALENADEDKRRSVLQGVLLPQTVTKRSISDQLGQILDIFKPGRRNSEPSPGLLMLLAVYTFGYAVGSNRSAFTRDNAVRHVRNRLSAAWSNVMPTDSTGKKAGSVTEGMYGSPLYAAVVQLIHSAFDGLRENPPGDGPLAGPWLCALQTACRAYVAARRAEDLARIHSFLSCPSITTLSSSNPLSTVKIVSGGWTLESCRFCGKAAPKSKTRTV